MFFSVETLPSLPSFDFSKCRALSQTTRDRLSAILDQRTALQRFGGAARLSVAEIAEMSDALGFSVDLLELCVLEELLPETSYRGFLANRGKRLRIPQTPIAVFAADFVYSRLLFALSALESARGEAAAALRSLTKPESLAALAKAVIDRLLPALHRLRRLNRNCEYVFGGLGDAERLAELNHGTAIAFEELLRVNFASVLAMKTLAAPLNPDRAVFLAQLARRTQLVAEDAAERFAGRAPSLRTLCQLAARFFAFLAMYALLRCNLYESEGLLNRTKDVKTALRENAALAAELARVAQRSATAENDNERAFAAFYDAFMAENVAASAKQCAAVKAELGETVVDVRRALEAIALTHDFIESLFAQ